MALLWLCFSGHSPSLILEEVLQSFGQVEPINGQPVHHTRLDH